MRNLNFRSITFVLVSAMLASTAVIGGCAEVADTGALVTIPRVNMNCTTSNCRTNATAPKINVVITRSGCIAPFFDAVRSTSTQSYNCTSVIGCQGEFSGWIDANGVLTTKMPSGSYSICACIDYDNNSAPFVNCDSRGTKDNIFISSVMGLQSITNWTD